MLRSFFADYILMATPNVSDISTLLLNIFNFETLNISQLTGYDDMNYVVEGAHVETGRHGKYVMKIVNVQDSNTTNLTEAITSILQSLHPMGLSTPQPIKSKNGKFVEYTSITGVTRKVVLLTYLNGLNHKQLRLTEENFLGICRSVGSCAGSLAANLHSLSTTVSLLPLRPDDPYMTENLHLSRSKLSVVPTDKIRDICSHVINVIENMHKLTPPLKKSLIHHDLCLENVIFCETEAKGYLVKGVIDFSDMNFSYSVFDAAIPIASCMYQTLFLCDSLDFVAARLVYLEFEQRCPLSENEKDFLFYAVLARFVSLRILGGFDVLHNPQTALHEEHDSEPLEHFIEKLWSLGNLEFNKKVLQ